jgi:hypothetical protein
MSINYDTVNDFREWLEFGIAKGWVSDVFCDTHDGGPMTDEMNEAWENGEDPCNTHIKVWDGD